jgi:hypothetical protein
MAIDIREKKDAVLGTIRREGVSFINLLDKTGEVSALYGVQSTPVKFLIDAKGNMVGAGLGYKKWDNEEMNSLIQLLMEQAG